MTEIQSNRPLNSDGMQRDRAIRLFSYLHELTGLRSRMIRHIDQYDHVIWFHEIPKVDGCFSITWDLITDIEESNIWIEVCKPHLTFPPEPPPVLRPWIDPEELNNSSLSFPNIRERVLISAQENTELMVNVDSTPAYYELEEKPELKAIWERYVEDVWWPWAKEDRPKRAAQSIYTDLFSMYQKQQRLGERYEIVMGLGLLAWKPSDGMEIRRHIIVTQTNLEFDMTRGVMRLGPVSEGPQPQLEQDMFEPTQKPDTNLQKKLEDYVFSLSESLWDGISVQKALKGYVHAISSQGQFENKLVPQETGYSYPTIHFAPAIILRKRSDRNLQRVFQTIKEQLERGEKLPEGIRRIVQISESDKELFDKQLDEVERNNARIAIEEIYFPLPSNNEQRQIIERLSTQQGVLVQGPPGTGKSHSIANIICHLLASGKRVLVTSHTARALKVLREKLPKEIADLCVVLLGNDRESLQALEDSVNGITKRESAWNPQRNEQLIFKLESDLDRVRRDEAVVLKKLRALREAETYSHSPMFGDYQGTAMQIALLARSRASSYSWIRGKILPGQQPPLSNREAGRLLRILRKVEDSLVENLKFRFLSPEMLISPDNFSRLVQVERKWRNDYEKSQAYRSYPGYSNLRKRSKEYRRTVENLLIDLLARYRKVSAHIQPWTDGAALQIMADRDRSWQDLLDETNRRLSLIKPLARNVDEIQITGDQELNKATLKADAFELLEFLNSGGKIRHFNLVKSKVVKKSRYLIEQVRVNGALCSEPKVLQKLIEWIEVDEHIDALHRAWDKHAPSRDTSVSRQVAEFEDLCEPLEAALKLHEIVVEIKGKLGGIPYFVEPAWHNVSQIENILSVLQSISIQEELEYSRRNLIKASSKIDALMKSGNAHPVMRKLLHAINSRDITEYQEKYKQLCILKALQNTVAEREALLKPLRKTAPDLAEAIVSSRSDLAWDGRLKQFVEAWNWTQADAWLREFRDTSAEGIQSRKLEDLREKKLKIILELSEAKAWRHCLENLTENERQHLVAWTKAVKKVGKGTGKYVARHRQAARKHMEQCRSAIPAWIMPVYRLAETVQPGADNYDVVIIDEASQSGPEALLLHYLAPKIIVVGDDRQISPSFAGINQEDVYQLRLKYLDGIPHSDMIGMDSSFFAHAEIKYGGRIRLREHYRCMPEIIQFSNNLCYQSDPLIPLRQFGMDRLVPVVQTQYVKEGYQRGRTPRIDNPPEADAMVRKILECIKDPAYVGKTMGVLSLIGEQQAREIERQLLIELGPEEMERRRLICGNAYAFQGDERDVMFLSMVSAPTNGRSIRALTMNSFEQRFNVAASRAKDQMWLFHSVTLSDLNPRCIRHKLLEYCLNPKVEKSTIGDMDIEELRRRANDADREEEQQPDPFDSWFEVDVFIKIVERGYRVIPQYEVMGKFIDLVVEGMRGRLAVECDGDVWHGAENYESDMTRQRQLERCGWPFWRVRGSAFYRDPDLALDDLWETLRKHGIYPEAEEQDYQGADLGNQEPGSSELDEPSSGVNRCGRTAKDTTSSREGLDEIRGKQAVLIKDDSELRKLENESISQEAKQLERVISESETVERNSTTAEVRLSPYKHWEAHSLPDPREAGIATVNAGLLEVIEVEGPMICRRAYRLYARAAGIQKVGREIRSIFNHAIYRASRSGLLEQENEYNIRNPIDRIVRADGEPSVILRERGARDFHEIPPSEIGLLMTEISKVSSKLAQEKLFRVVLEHYEIKRLTSKIKDKLIFALENFTDFA